MTADTRLGREPHDLRATPAGPQPRRAVPLCVDLDGTLIRSDTLLEAILLLLKMNPLFALLLPLWTLRGRAHLKTQIARRVALNAATLPYHTQLLSWLESEHETGRALWLCTASHESLAQPVAVHLGLFEGIIASDGQVNRQGAARAHALLARFGEQGFDYCGNELRDVLVWRYARGAIVVGGVALETTAARHTTLVRSFAGARIAIRNVLRALRPHQWAKNALLLVPLMAAHRLGDPPAVLAAALAVIAFCLCASSVYVLNDLFDLQADRAHPRKCTRPFACGELPIGFGLTLSATLLVLGASLAAFLPAFFALAFAGYYVLTLAYSLSLKGRVIVDALVLAGLYTMRIIAGAAAIRVVPSFWLLLFSVFLFLSLAFVKRFAELDALRRQQRLRAVGRGYHVEDLPVLQSLGTAAGYLSVLVLALYINSPAIESLYRRPRVIWLLCVLMLYWISRVWMKAQRGTMHDDPVVFALKDRMSLTVGVLAALTVAAAI